MIFWPLKYPGFGSIPLWPREYLGFPRQSEAIVQKGGLWEKCNQWGRKVRAFKLSNPSSSNIPFQKSPWTHFRKDNTTAQPESSSTPCIALETPDFIVHSAFFLKVCLVDSEISYFSFFLVLNDAPSMPSVPSSSLQLTPLVLNGPQHESL